MMVFENYTILRGGKHMRKKIISIWSVLLVLVVSIAVLAPGCDGGACIGEIEVKATLCDAPWLGAVNYTLTGPGATAAPITGTNVTALFDNVECGNWTCSYDGGGPDGAYFVDITTSPTQEVTNGATITFTLNFEQCTIEVEATLCDAPWEGDVQYTLTGPGSPITGTDAPASFNVECGNWTCSYDGGGPPGAFLVDITPDPTQEVTSCGNITFTLNFEEEQDAWIVASIDPWTLNGNPIPLMYDAFPCDVIDVHFLQGVNGCEGYQAAVNETSWLFIHLVSYYDNLVQDFIPPLGPVQLYVVNDDCAVDKTAEPPALAAKVSQMTTFFDAYIPPGEFIELFVCEPVIVDVETIWTLVKEVDYLKSINWFGISLSSEFAPGLEHECVLFELIVPPSIFLGGTYHFQLQAAAEVELMDDEDVDLGNNDAMTPILDLYVNVP